MSTSELLQKLETCAQIVMAPDQVSTEDRMKAQEEFLNFQKTKSPFDMCRNILETSSNQFILFQTGCCLKNGVIREWSQLSSQQSQTLFSYLFEYVNRRPNEQYVTEELMLVSAIIIKRIMINDPEKDQDKALVVQLCDIIKNQSSSVEVRLNACTAILLILGEFCTINQNADFGLSWYTHLTAKRHFEKFRLKDIFQNTVQVLFEHLKVPEEGRRTPQWIKLSTKLIKICETVLSWNFNFMLETFSIISAHYAKNRDRLESMVFQPPSEWIDSIINLIPFFFEVYVSFRSLEEPNLVHHSLQCLTQLSTVSGPLLYLRREIRKKFTEIFMTNTIKLFNLIFDVITIHEAVFLSNIINSVCNHLRSNSSLQFCDFSLTRCFLDVMSKLSCKILLESIRVNALNDEENIANCNQAIDYLLNSWMVVINVVQFIHQLHSEMPILHTNMSEFIKIEELVAWTKPIFETYVRAHLCEPEGLMPLSSYIDHDEIHEFEDEDHVLYREQLTAIGSIAQVDGANSLNTLTQLLILKLNQFESCIMTENNSEANKAQWICISEDIHWILLISMHFITMHGDCEIPASIVRLSIDSSPNIQATQAALASADFNQTSIDPVVRFIIVLLKMVNMEKCLLERQMSHLLSPQVSSTLANFISRFMYIYLVPPEFDTVDLSLSLNTCFGADSPTAKQLIEYFVEHLILKFVSLSSEVDLLLQSTEGLKSFCKYKDRLAVLQNCSSLRVLLEKFTRNEFPNLNGGVRRNIYYVFAVVYTNNLDAVIDPLISSYQKFCAELESGGNKETIRDNFLQIVDCTQGISNGLSIKNFSSVWNKFLLHLYNDLPRVLGLMHNYSTVVQSILELLFTFSVSFCCFFKESENVEFYNTAVNILTEYARHNNEKFSVDSTRPEELQEEFILILQFLNDLSTQDIFFFFTNPTASNSSLSTIIGKVVLTSLNIIMPLMNQEMLENPKLCNLYYKLLEFIAQDLERFKGFPLKLFESFLRCVEYVFKAQFISNDIKIIGFKIIVELGCQSAIEPDKNQEIIKFLRPFFRSIFEYIFCELSKNDPCLRDTVAIALYALLCCYKDSYREIVLETLHCVGDSNAELNIANSLFEIIEQTGLDCSQNQNRIAFKKSFSDFTNKLNSMLSL